MKYRFSDFEIDLNQQQSVLINGNNGHGNGHVIANGNGHPKTAKELVLA